MLAFPTKSCCRCYCLVYPELFRSGIERLEYFAVQRNSPISEHCHSPVEFRVHRAPASSSLGPFRFRIPLEPYVSIMPATGDNYDRYCDRQRPLTQKHGSNKTVQHRLVNLRISYFRLAVSATEKNIRQLAVNIFLGYFRSRLG